MPRLAFILRPYLAGREWHRHIDWRVPRIDRDMVDVEGSQIGNQQPAGGIGSSNLPVFLADENAFDPIGVHHGEAVVNLVGREQAAVSKG